MFWALHGSFFLGVPLDHAQHLASVRSNSNYESDFGVFGTADADVAKQGLLRV